MRRRALALYRKRCINNAKRHRAVLLNFHIMVTNAAVYIHVNRAVMNGTGGLKNYLPLR